MIVVRLHVILHGTWGSSYLVQARKMIYYSAGQAGGAGVYRTRHGPKQPSP